MWKGIVRIYGTFRTYVVFNKATKMLSKKIKNKTHKFRLSTPQTKMYYMYIYF